MFYLVEKKTIHFFFLCDYSFFLSSILIAHISFTFQTFNKQKNPALSWNAPL